MANAHEPAKGRGQGLTWPVAGIRHYLILLSLALLLPLLAFAGLLATRYADAERRVVEAQRTDVSNNLNYLVDRELESIASLLRGLTASPDLAARRFPQFQAHADGAARHVRLEQIALIDRQGQPVGSMAAMTTPALLDEVLLAMVFAGRSAVSDMRLDLAPRAAFVVSVPVLVDGVVTYALNAVVGIDRLPPLFDEARLKPDWIAAVVDRRGIFLARSRAEKRFVGQPAHPAVVAAATGSATEGLFANITLDGTSTSSSFRRSKSGWTSVVGVPTAILDAPRKRALTILGLAGLGLSTLGLGLAYLLGGRIAEAARSLQRAALDIVDGRRPADTIYPIIELQDVTTAFDFAAALARERNAAEDRLRLSEERLRLAIEAGAFGTWDLDVASGQAVW